jgi:chemotaxis regulatin CheY-phosphate phosphatase CheZ
MNTDRLSKKLGQLVNLLREDQKQPVSIREIASITEVLVAVVHRYFSILDTSIYRELQSVSAQITDTRAEIARVRPKDMKSRIPAAGDQLDAIVVHTEEATNTIMEATEEIMSADAADQAAYKATVEGACLRIFEACSFQDITGQRVSKVVATLGDIEERVGKLLEALGSEFEDSGGGAESPKGDDGLLSGPALAGEGIDQNEVDALLDEKPPPPKSAQSDIDALFD